jgi:hypothetical protein
MKKKKYTEGGDPIIGNSSNKSARYLPDIVNFTIGSGQNPSRNKLSRSLINSGLTEDDKKLFTYMTMFNQRPDIQNMSPEQRIQSFYDIPSNDAFIQKTKDQLKSVGYGPIPTYRNSPDMQMQEFQNAKFLKKGGMTKNYNFAGTIEDPGPRYPGFQYNMPPQQMNAFDNIQGIQPFTPNGQFQSAVQQPQSNQSQSPNATMRNQLTFGINYGYLAGSNAAKGVLGYLAERRTNKEYDSYYRAQSNPLSMLPYTPNTSDQAQTGMEYSKYGGTFQDDKGKNYYVTGGPTQQDPKPTRSDSLALLNSSNALLKYYQKYKRYNETNALPGEVESAQKMSRQMISDQINQINGAKGVIVPMGNSFGRDPNFKMSDYYKEYDKNRYFQREDATGVIDTRSPWPLYDKRIQPQKRIAMNNIDKDDSMFGDDIEIYMYDPLAITPWDLLSPQQREERVKKYGNPSQKAKSSPKKPITTPPRPLNPSQVSGISNSISGANVSPIPFNPVQTINPEFTYGQIPPGPYSPEGGQSVYDKSGKLVGYKDSKGNSVDASYFGIIEKKQDGGYVDFESEFDNDLTTEPKIEPTLIQPEIEQSEVEETTQPYVDDPDTFQEFKSSSERLTYLMEDGDNGNVDVDNPYGSIADKISRVESQGSYTAFNSKGGGAGAVGKYQFRWNLHKKNIQNVTGVNSKEDFLNNPYAQEKYFQYWDRNVLTPNAQGLLQMAQAKDPNTTLDDVKKQVHFSGAKGAQDFYMKGKITTDANGTNNFTYGKFQKGGTYDLDESQIQNLIKQGYKFDIL